MVWYTACFLDSGLVGAGGAFADEEPDPAKGNGKGGDSLSANRKKEVMAQPKTRCRRVGGVRGSSGTLTEREEETQ